MFAHFSCYFHNCELFFSPLICNVSSIYMNTKAKTVSVQSSIKYFQCINLKLFLIYRFSFLCFCFHHYVKKSFVWQKCESSFSHSLQLPFERFTEGSKFRLTCFSQEKKKQNFRNSVCIGYCRATMWKFLSYLHS